MSARPGRIAGSVDVDLPRPRADEARETERFFGLVTAVREILRSGGDPPVTEPGPVAAGEPRTATI
jgi:NitT/TauT family transport system ATP-binding protein